MRMAVAKGQCWASPTPTAYNHAAVAGFVGSFLAGSRQPSLMPSMSIVGIAATAGAWDFAGTVILR